MIEILLCICKLVALTYAQVDGPVHQVKRAEHYREDHPAEGGNQSYSSQVKNVQIYTLNICRCRLLSCQICGSGVPGVEHVESGEAEALLPQPSPACTPGATSPEEGEGWGFGGLAYVLPVTEGAGQHAARVEPYAGLRRNNIEKMFQHVRNVEKMFQDVSKC